ncbi:hypothetical protein L228DRAFT_285301 [Xylona heveae TC161]|uniref:3-oxo-5-alpha-steroid 4-dehydrogenase C-terminal domain-containing protein n=1 Tax=Xylona heveae (strain CBS 132557 / TC161) TaxID=1328760 RepID=A0A165A3I6_XYLHT|nr:hypothetical protein L228DRAFT_285301 [Xylona heveae TC161]KZF19902.1 hypothetical protein L228DRAFT_285301 [Xylona heveae TC161]
MASKTITLSIRPRGKPIKKLPEETAVAPEDSTEQLYKKIAASAGTSVHRLRITKGIDGSVVGNAKNVTIAQVDLHDKSTIYVKDLGPQLGWRFVYIIEYLGPLLIHPLVYYLRPYIFSLPPFSVPSSKIGAPSDLQTLSCALITLHFLKREFETIFVHRFSLATMPARNIVKNSGHYWLFSGLFLALSIYRPTGPTDSPYSPLLTPLGIALFFIGELGNLWTHLTLRGLRPAGSTERGVPQTWPFKLVTCPNYMFEAYAWTGVLLLTRSLAAALFLVLGVGQMAVWAKKKESRYRKEFGANYQKKRFAMIPGLV